MKNYIKNYLIFIILIAVLIASTFALTSWWNPFSWGIWNRVFHFQQTTQNPVACPMITKLCPDGSSVGRTGPKCEFAPCPTANCVPEGRVYGANDINLYCCDGLSFQPTTQSGTVGKCVKLTDQTASWKTYTNSEYGFEISFPQRWMDYKTEKVDNKIFFELKNKQDGNYHRVFSINMYSTEEWNRGPHSFEGTVGGKYINEKNGNVFSYSMGQDDEGYIGFPEPVSGQIYQGPFYDVEKNIILTFKFTK